MEEYELIPLIRQAVREELAPILMGKIQATDQNFRATARRFSGEANLGNLRILHPYGLASRPSAGMECVVMPIANDPTHLNILTQNDINRPQIQDGEVCLYGPEGQVVYLNAAGEIHQGSQAASEPVVLGNVLTAFLEAVLNAFLNAAEIVETPTGPGYLSPAIRTQLTQLMQQYLQESSSNILGQKNFVERGGGP
jgi:phage gp45-like